VKIRTRWGNLRYLGAPTGATGVTRPQGPPRPCFARTSAASATPSWSACSGMTRRPSHLAGLAVRFRLGRPRDDRRPRLLLASRALAPVIGISRRAARIAQGDFAARLDPPVRLDEVGEMTAHREHVSRRGGLPQSRDSSRVSAAEPIALSFRTRRVGGRWRRVRIERLECSRHAHARVRRSPWDLRGHQRHRRRGHGRGVLTCPQVRYAPSESPSRTGGPASPSRNWSS
jgi:hypothetical protein